MTPPDPDARDLRTPPPAVPPLPRAPFVMLGLMTLATLGGPFGIILTLRGGANRDWPPDRPVEWAAVLGITALVLGLMVGCVAIAARARRREVAARGAAVARRGVS